LDNASSDNSVRVIQKNHPDISLTRATTNYGFAKGNNLLINECLKDKSVKYVALINSDLTLDPKWTENIVRFAESRSNVACLQGETLDYFNHSLIDSQHIFINEYFRSVQYGHGERKTSSDYSRKVFGVNAAAAMYTREFIESQLKERLFDEKFFMYLEDVDVALRSVVMGWDNYYVAGATAYHMGSVSAKKRSSTFSLYMIFRNQPALLFKSLPLGVFLRHLPLVLRVERGIYKQLYKVEGEKAAREARRGRLVGLLRLPLYFADRAFIRRYTKISNSDLEYTLNHKGFFG
jgi:GT2 family glycosyltransferase